jgi:Tol biopolymer transport system component
MTAPRDLDRVLRDHFETYADRAVLDGQLDAIVDRTARLGQRPAWLAGLRSQTMSATNTIARPAVPRATWVVAAVGLLIILAIAALVISGARLTKPTPFNGMIAFGRMDAAQGDTVSYVINPDGTHERQLRPETHEAVFWSPDGSKLSFGPQTINPDGTGYQDAPWKRGTLNVPCWDWSPDGNWCLAEGWDESDPSRDGLYLVSMTGGTDIRQVTHHRDVPGVFSRDGTRMAFQRNDGLWVVNVDGSRERQVGGLRIPTDGVDMSWADDDSAILVQSAGRLYRVDVATGEPTPVRIAAEPEAELWGGVYSPDGTRILFRRPQGTFADLFTMLADGTDVVRLTTTAADERFIDWGTHPLDN